MRKRSIPAGGFTLIELLVVITLVVMLMIGLLEMFERNSALARRETQVADMQQALRTSQNVMTRMIRMSGRGGLVAMIDDNGVRRIPAMNVRNNAGLGGVSQEIAQGFADTPLAMQGSDILAVRGVFSSPVYQVNDNLAGTMTLFDSGGAPTTDPTQAVSGTVIVSDPSPTGRPQDLDALNAAINGGVSEALVLVSPVDESIYAVVELVPGNSAAGASQVTLGFQVAGGSYEDEYRTLYRSGTAGDPQLPAGLTSAAWVSILEEYRFYVRDADPEPTLSMARMFPGSETPYGGLAGTSLDIAEGVRDFQVALGFDSNLGAPLADRNGDGVTDENDIELTETADGDNDDWLFNGDSDDPMVAPWVPPWGAGGVPMPQLHYVRISTLARVRTPDRNYQARQIPTLEDTVTAPLNTREERLHRRRLMQTTIDLRNL